jgi:DUF1680 family protein
MGSDGAGEAAPSNAETELATQKPVRASGSRAVEARAIEIGAVPYFAWANRSVEGMRVWIPVRA